MRLVTLQCGYTLIELIIVIAIIGLIAVVAEPVAARTIDAMQLRSDELIVVTQLRALQRNATARHHTITFDAETGLSTPDDLKRLGLSGNAGLSIAEPISWFSDGTTTGGRLKLRRGSQSRTITVAWLTGSISVE